MPRSFEPLIGLGIEVEIEAFFVGGQIEQRLHVFAEEELAERDLCLFTGCRVERRDLERSKRKQRDHGQRCGSANLREKEHLGRFRGAPKSAADHSILTSGQCRRLGHTAGGALRSPYLKRH